MLDLSRCAAVKPSATTASAARVADSAVLWLSLCFCDTPVAAARGVFAVLASILVSLYRAVVKSESNGIIIHTQLLYVTNVGQIIDVAAFEYFGYSVFSVFMNLPSDPLDELRAQPAGGGGVMQRICLSVCWTVGTSGIENTPSIRFRDLRR